MRRGKATVFHKNNGFFAASDGHVSQHQTVHAALTVAIDTHGNQGAVGTQTHQMLRTCGDGDDVGPALGHGINVAVGSGADGAVPAQSGGRGGIVLSITYRTIPHKYSPLSDYSISLLPDDGIFRFQPAGCGDALQRYRKGAIPQGRSSFGIKGSIVPFSHILPQGSYETRCRITKKDCRDAAVLLEDSESEFTEAGLTGLTVAAEDQRAVRPKPHDVAGAAGDGFNVLPLLRVEHTGGQFARQTDAAIFLKT